MFGHRKFRDSAILACMVGATALIPLLAQASPQCTTEPKDKWLPETDMKAKIAALGYRDIKVFKTTKSGCYEIYGTNAEGKKAEVYFNPVTGAVVQANID